MNRLTIDFGVLLDTIYTQPLAFVFISMAVVYALLVASLMYWGRK